VCAIEHGQKQLLAAHLAREKVMIAVAVRNVPVT